MTGLFASHHLEIETLTPVAIGAGGPPLRADLDFVAEGDRLWIIDRERAAAEVLSDDELAKAGRLELDLHARLQPADYPRLARYSVQLKAHAEAVRELVRVVRDVHGRPYLPGSSIKGALRTALGWALLGEPGRTLSDADFPFLSARGSRPPAPKAFDDRAEQRRFAPRAREGKWPNYDLLRALHIADSAPLAADALCAYTVVIATARGGTLDEASRAGTGLTVEALPPGIRATTTVTVDQRVLGAEELGLRAFAGWFGPEALCQRLNARAQELIQRERAWYLKLRNAQALTHFYTALGQRRLAANEALLPLGWGTGWRGKTWDDRLEAYPNWQHVYQAGGLGRVPGGSGRVPHQEFPRSRRVVKEAGVLSQPMGWALIRLRPERRR